MPLDELTTEELQQAFERLRQEAAELRDGLEVAIETSQRSREEARRLRQELRKVSGRKRAAPWPKPAPLAEQESSRRPPTP